MFSKEKQATSLQLIKNKNYQNKSERLCKINAESFALEFIWLIDVFELSTNAY